MANQPFNIFALLPGATSTYYTLAGANLQTAPDNTQYIQLQLAQNTTANPNYNYLQDGASSLLISVEQLLPLLNGLATERLSFLSGGQITHAGIPSNDSWVRVPSMAGKK